MTYLLDNITHYNKANAVKNPNQAEVLDATLKSLKHSKTGVDLRWNSRNEYRELTQEQKDELSEWQEMKDGKATYKAQKRKVSGTAGGKGGGKGRKKSNKKLRSQVSALST